MLNKNLIKWQCEKGSREKQLGKPNIILDINNIHIVINFKNINRN